MNDTTNKIEVYMEKKREHLGSNLRELQDKVKSAGDWHTHFKNHPLVSIGVAVGVGAALASLLPRAQRRSPPLPHRVVSTPSIHREEISTQWSMVKSAAIALAGQKLVQYLDGAVPGFKEQVEKVGLRGSQVR